MSERGVTLLGTRERHRRAAGFERRAGRQRVLGPGEQMRVDRERHARVGVPELATHEHHVEPLGDEQRGVVVAQAVQGEPPVSPHPSPMDGLAEGLAHLAVVEVTPRM